jgi:hypothetical protein
MYLPANAATEISSKQIKEPLRAVSLILDATLLIRHARHNLERDRDPAEGKSKVRDQQKESCNPSTKESELWTFAALSRLL